MSATRPGLDIAVRAVGAPVNRILWSVQAGVVLAAGGLGLWFAKASVIEEAAQALNVVAVLAIALGVGFVAIGARRIRALTAARAARKRAAFDPCVK